MSTSAIDTNDAAAIQAAQEGVAVCVRRRRGFAHRSFWGRIKVSDGDRLRFLHNQSHL
ncbi:MAG: hypothetical protein KME49_32925 [Brasilonema octagenarum HA4186-MV1]|jgi:hypothetical protein|nr:hypothetical protein [Brasilonema octagenarum HA4186-MV1]